MKKVIKKVIIFGLIVIVLVGFSIFFFNSARLTPENPSGKTIYYTVIKNENTKINDEQRYEYILDSYNKKGNKKSLTFTAGKQLREDAYVELFVAPLRGVTHWQEVEWDELPAKVQNAYAK